MYKYKKLFKKFLNLFAINIFWFIYRSPKFAHRRSLCLAKKKYFKDPKEHLKKYSELEFEPDSNTQLHEEIKKQLSHFLINFRAMNRLTQAQMGEKLGYSQQQYKRVEDGYEERISNSVSYIKKFADLTSDKKVSDFVSYLINEPPHLRSSNLSNNEQILLSCFSRVDREDRRLFIEAFCKHEDDSRFPKLIKFLSLLPHLNSDFLDLFTLVLIEVKAKKDFIDLEDKSEIYNRLRKKHKRSYKRKTEELVKNH